MMPFDSRKRRKNLLRRTFGVFLIALTLAWVGLLVMLQADSPDRIFGAPARLTGDLEGRVVPDLVAEHVDSDGTIWCVRGYTVYKSTDGYNFARAFRVPSGGLLGWLGNIPWLRTISGYHEVCGIYPLRSGTILAFAGGRLWRSPDGGKTWDMIHTIRRHGIMRGRGIMPGGLVEDNDGIVYYGEYHRNTEKEPVFIYRSCDDGKTWQEVYAFRPGQICHIHSLSVDPFTNTLWVTTGDTNQESMIARSEERGRSFRIIGTGDQLWRTVGVVFTRDAILWGTDSSKVQNWICRMDRANLGVEKVCKVDGPIFYSATLCDGSLVFGRSVEGGKAEWSDKVSIWLSRDGRSWSNIPLAARQSKGRQAVLRFPRGKCLPYLLVAPLNTEAFSGDLLRLSLAQRWVSGGAE